MQDNDFTPQMQVWAFFKVKSRSVHPWRKVKAMKTIIAAALGAVVCLAPFSDAAAQSIGRIDGDWSNQSGYNITIRRAQLGGWDLWGSAGQGSIQLDGSYGGNIRVEADSMVCYFRATVLRGEQDMRWQMKAHQGRKCEDLDGIFNRTAD